MTTKSPFHFSLLVLLCAVALAICAPAFQRSFASDDYCTLAFITKNQSVLVPGFFRPGGDLTLKWTYFLFGLNPFYFYLVNAMLHGINAWLVFVLCERLRRVNSVDSILFSVFSAFVFLCYHSLGEVVFWTIGRGISLAVTLSLLAMIFFFSSVNHFWKYLLVSFCYFAALACYESVLLVPAILLFAIPLFRIEENFRRWLMVFMSTATINIIIRIWATGKLWAAYKGEVFSKPWLDYPELFVKVVWRTFVPATNQPLLFAGVAMIVVTLAVFMTVRLKDEKFKRMAAFAWMGIICASLIAMFYGVSTRNPEGDRLLYLPGVFFSLLIVSLVFGIQNTRARVAVVTVFGLLQLLSVYRTRQNWVEADRQSANLVGQLKSVSTRPLYIVNLPSDYHGSYQFRNCFEDALQFYGMNPEGIHVINQLRGGVDVPADQVISKTDERTFDIWPQTRVGFETDSTTFVSVGRATTRFEGMTPGNFAAWNGERLVFLSTVNTR